MTLFVPPAHQAAVREKLSQLIHVPFKFDFSGSQIIFSEPGEDYSQAERDRGAQPIAAFRELSPIRAGGE